jgi:hypothetical protein
MPWLNDWFNPSTAHQRLCSSDEVSRLAQQIAKTIPGQLGRQLVSDTGCGRRRTILSDASVGGVDDQHVGLGPVGDVGRDRSQQPPGEAAAESDIADDQQVRVDLLDQIH